MGKFDEFPSRSRIDLQTHAIRLRSRLPPTVDEIAHVHTSTRRRGRRTERSTSTSRSTDNRAAASFYQSSRTVRDTQTYLRALRKSKSPGNRTLFLPLQCAIFNNTGNPNRVLELVAGGFTGISRTNARKTSEQRDIRSRIGPAVQIAGTILNVDGFSTNEGYIGEFRHAGADSMWTFYVSNEPQYLYNLSLSFFFFISNWRNSESFVV